MSDYDRLLAEAMRDNLPDHPEEVSEDEARKLVAESRRRIEEGAAEFLVGRLVSESQERSRQRERADKRRSEAERERAETVMKAKKAWERLWGPKIAEQIDPEATYWLLRADQSLYAFASREAVAEARGALEATHRAEIVGARGRLTTSKPPGGGPSALDTDEGTPAVNLGGAVNRLGLELVGVEPDSERLAAIACGKQEAEQAKAAAEAEREKARRQREREEAKFGVSVSE